MSKITYRRIVPSFWTDPDVKRKLDRDQKIFLIYLFTNHHGHACGVYHLPLIFVQDELGFTPEQTLALFEGPCAPFVTYDPETEEVFVHAMADHQIEGGLHGQDKRIQWVEKHLRAVASEALLRRFHERYSTWNLDWVSIVPGISAGHDPGHGGNRTSKPKPKGHRKALTKGHGKALTEGREPVATRDRSSQFSTESGNGLTAPKPKGHAEPLGKPAAVAATATATEHPAVPTAPRARANRASPPAEPQDGCAIASPTATATARRRAADVISQVYHRGRDVVTVGEYSETLEVALNRWDRAVDAGADPQELTDQMGLVRAVSDFGPDEPITVSVFLGPDRHETRERCQAEWLKRQRPAEILPAVGSTLPTGDESFHAKKARAKQMLAEKMREEGRASA